MLLLLLAVCAAGGTAFAQATDNPERLINVAEDSSGGAAAGGAQPLVSTWDFVRMVLILAAVVGAIYLFFFLLRRSASPARPETDLIRLLGQRSLTGSRTLYLVEVGTSIFFVGAADSHVSLLAEITDKESLDAVRLSVAQSPQRPQVRRSFASLLGGLFSPAGRSLTPHDSLSFLKRQKDRLKRM